MTMLGSMATASLLLLFTNAGATTICRWVDNTGRTQFAEAVPQRYRSVAVCTDLQRDELPLEQREAAEQRAAVEQAQTRRKAARAPVGAASNVRRPAKAASQPSVKRPSKVVTAATDCTTWWRIYDESVECLRPYRTTRGATKVEAFDKCNVIASPEPTCGPRTN